MKHRILMVLISLDQFLNTIFGGAPDETISSRWGRSVRRAHRLGTKPPLVPRIGCWLLGLLDPCHCDESIEFRDDGTPSPHHIGGKGGFGK